MHKPALYLLLLAVSLLAQAEDDGDTFVQLQLDTHDLPRSTRDRQREVANAAEQVEHAVVRPGLQPVDRLAEDSNGRQPGELQVRKGSPDWQVRALVTDGGAPFIR